MGEHRLFGGFLSLSSSCRSEGSGGNPVAAVGYSEGSWVPEGTPLFFWGGGPLSACPSGWGRAGLGAARRGSAVGYFNERCQGLQRREEAEGEAESVSLSKLGLGWGGLACRCRRSRAATVTRSAPYGDPRAAPDQVTGAFPHALSFSFPRLPLRPPTFSCFCLCRVGDGRRLGEPALRSWVWSEQVPDPVPLGNGGGKQTPESSRRPSALLLLSCIRSRRLE